MEELPHPSYPPHPTLPLRHTMPPCHHEYAIQVADGADTYELATKEIFYLPYIHEQI